MYLPRTLISHLYQHLRRTHHALSPPVLILVALEPDALCACRILTALLKRDYIQHKIQPVAGYGDLSTAGDKLVQPMRTQQGGSGGLVVCLGVGGLVDLSAVLGLEEQDGEDPAGGVEVWLLDARRPWNLGNVFGGNPADHALQETNGNARLKGPEVVKGKIQPSYRPGRGGIIVYDNGDIDEELAAERDAYGALAEMPDVDDNDGSDDDSDRSDTFDEAGQSRKRKAWSDREDEDSDIGDPRPRRRRRSNTHTPISSSPTRRPPSAQAEVPRSPSVTPPSSPLQLRQPSARSLRRRLIRLRRKHSAVLSSYYSLGTSYSEPISSLLYSLAEDLGREDNDLLWYAIVGVSSLELYGRSMTGVGISSAAEDGGSAGWGGQRGERIRQVLRDEVRRLNPPDQQDADREILRGEASGVIPTTAKSPTDTSIRLSPEPRFLLIRHWSLYDSMLHSPYLSARLHIWSDVGRKRLHKLLAKMGVSLSQCKQSYTHMDMELKKGLRKSLLTYAPMYGLYGLVPPAATSGRAREGWGFVRSWGWKATLSAIDVGVIVGAVLEVGKAGTGTASVSSLGAGRTSEQVSLIDEDGRIEGAEWISRFWEAYDALGDVETLKHALPTAQYLHRAILRTGTSLLEKKQVRHLRAFRMAVVKEGPDVQLFTHPAALTKLALWVGEAIAEQEREKKGKGGKGTPLVLAGLNESRGVYIVVGTGGGGGVVDWKARTERKEKIAARAKRKQDKAAERERKKQQRAAERAERGEDEDVDEDDATESEESDNRSDDESNGGMEERGYGRNRFGNAFQEVIEETNARVRIDSFEHSVVEVKKEDLSGFLESLSMKAVVG